MGVPIHPNPERCAVADKLYLSPSIPKPGYVIPEPPKPTYFVYVERLDECGEGSRAKMYSFSTREDAQVLIDACLENDNQDLTCIQLIEGSCVFTANPS